MQDAFDLLETLGAEADATPAPPTKPAPAAPVQEATGPCPRCGGNHFWRDPGGWQCSACRPMPGGFLGETLTLPGGRALDPHPYRINLDGHAQVVWLAPGLSPAEVVERARRQYAPDRVADPGVAPAGGWPRLEDLATDSAPDPAALVEAAVGRLSCRPYLDKQGEPQAGLSVLVNELMTAPARKALAVPRPAKKPPEPAAVDFNDEIPF